MRPVTRLLLPVVPLVALVAGGVGLAPAQAGRPQPPSGDGPDKVVVIVVDALSREIVQKYGMDNVESLMREGADSPNGYLGHLGSVTVVSHNVITTGALPKHMGWTDEGYRDVDHVLSDTGGMWLTSDFGSTEMFKLQEHAGYPKLAHYLHEKSPGSKVVAVSPKTYAAWGLGGPEADSIVTFGSATCASPGRWRGPSGVNVPSYLTVAADQPCGRFYVQRDKSYDTLRSPAWMYPLADDRYMRGDNPDHQGGDVWAADAAIKVMQNEPDWSGVFVTLPGVDKAAHMWGSIDDPNDGDPLTHLPDAARTADAQVGKIMSYLRDSGQLDDTLVVLTADHGSVPGRHFYGLDDGSPDRGYYNWYYGTFENDGYLKPQPALQPLVDTGNVAMSYSDSMLRAWLKDQSPAKVRQAARVMDGLPGVSAVWVRTPDQEHFKRWSVHRNRMTEPERAWFDAKAQGLLDSTAAPYGADVIATLLDDTTYSVAGDHGGIQRRAQQIPIVFAGGGVGSRDLRAPVRSVDIMPTVMRALHIPADAGAPAMDGRAYALPGLG
jgi:arylsulfatase A-like enzyme